MGHSGRGPVGTSDALGDHAEVAANYLKLSEDNEMLKQLIWDMTYMMGYPGLIIDFCHVPFGHRDWCNIFRRADTLGCLYSPKQEKKV